LLGIERAMGLMGVVGLKGEEVELEDEQGLSLQTSWDESLVEVRWRFYERTKGDKKSEGHIL
jgi:hypothetical protein